MNISLLTLRKTIAHFIGRYHVVLFVVVVLGGLAVVVLRLNAIIVDSAQSDGYTPASNNASFDQATIDRVKQLKTRSETSSQLDLSKGRTNPFAE